MIRGRDHAAAHGSEPVIDWVVPPGKTDWLFGTGATRTERWLVWFSVAASTTALAATAWASSPGWRWWHALVLALLLVDLVGGVVANSLGSAKRLYSPLQQHLAADLRLRHGWFTVAHVHPFLIAVLFPGGSWEWAAYWYVSCLVGVALVRAVAVPLQRPVAAGAAAAVLVLGSEVPAPDLLGWVGPVLLLKLVIAHSVTEAPFRPGSGRLAPDVTS